jgi:hypothetical protein
LSRHFDATILDLLTPKFQASFATVNCGNSGAVEGGYGGAAVTTGASTDAGIKKAAGFARRSTVMSSLATAGLIVVTANIALAQNVQAPPPASVAPTAQPAPAQGPAAPPASTLAPQPPPVADAAPTPAPEKRGFSDDVARWWNDSVADFNAKWKEQQTKLDDFNKKSAEAAKGAAAATQQAMKNAADAVVKSATSKVIEVQEPCAIAGNGAADCASAAVNACKAKGFADGQPLDVRTAEKCNASLWLQGQRQATAACPVETVVLRAACQ